MFQRFQRPKDSLAGLSPIPNSTIATVRQHHVLKPLCVEESDTAQRAPDKPKSFKVRLADGEGRRRSASFLVQRRYAWRGYRVGTTAESRPNQITLSAFNGEETVATISVGLDSALGLFVDKLYRKDVDRIRGQQRKVCEFTKLAVDGEIRSNPVLAALFHIAYIYVRRINYCSDLVVEVNPRHVLFYKRMLGFTDCGAERVDPRITAPAVLLRLDLAFAQQQIAEMGGHVELATQRRSLYPYFFSLREETGIEWRLRAFG